MEVNFFTTAVEGSNIFNDVADFCLSPVRLFCGEERSYHIIKNEHGAVVNTLVDEVALRSYRVVKVVFAVMLGVMVVPVVIGLGFKCIALLCGSYADYQAVEQMEPGLYITSNGLPLIPTIAKPDINTNVDLHNYQLDNLLTVWDRVGRGRQNYRHERETLQEWIRKAPKHGWYFRLNDDNLQKEASAQVVTQTRMILQQFDAGQISNEKKEAIILKIIDSAGICAATWVELTQGIYMDLMTGGFQDYMLRLIQKFKEGLVQAYVQVNLNSLSWHLINKYRYVHGSSFGFVTDNLELDPHYQIEPCDWFDDVFKNYFLKHYTLQGLVDNLELEMHKDMEQYEETLEQLKAVVQKDNPDIGDGLPEYVKATYFHPFKGDLTQTEEYQAFDAEMEAARGEIEESTRKLRALDADLRIAACEQRLSATNEGWMPIVAQQQLLTDQVRQLQAQIAGATGEERGRIAREQGRLNRESAGLEQDLKNLVDDDAWKATVTLRSKLISDQARITTALERAERTLDTLPGRRDEAMRGIELENRRFINPAGVVRLLQEFGIAIAVN